MDIASSIQLVTEEILLKISKTILKETKQKNLCLAGGVALNCVANGVLLKSNLFDKIWIQPAAGDAGGSLGAALCLWYMKFAKKRLISKNNDSMQGSFLGPSYDANEIEKQLHFCEAKFQYSDNNELLNLIVDGLQKGYAIGLMQGRMEFGPRSLGARSIIADPRSPKMQKQLNLKVKFRESFRPFAPSILKEFVNEWFDTNIYSPYMLLVLKIKNTKRRKMTRAEEKKFGIDKLNVPRSSVPAITHIDYSARVQTIDKDLNPFFYELVDRFRKKTNCPMVVNTSFNIRGEPIVCSPTDAFKCFMGTDLDILVIDNYILRKEDQKKSLKISYKDNYELD